MNVFSFLYPLTCYVLYGRMFQEKGQHGYKEKINRMIIIIAIIIRNREKMGKYNEFKQEINKKRKRNEERQ